MLEKEAKENCVQSSNALEVCSLNRCKPARSSSFLGVEARTHRDVVAGKMIDTFTWLALVTETACDSILLMRSC